MTAGRPLKFQSVEELQENINDYFIDAEENGKPYTITGLALSLGCDRDTLLNYEEKEEFFGTIKEAKLKCQNYAEEFLFNGKNATGAIFNLKNNYGWKDKTEVDTNISGGMEIKATHNHELANEFSNYLKGKTKS